VVDIVAMAWTRGHPAVVLPNSDQAVSDSRSVSQYGWTEEYQDVVGDASTGCCGARWQQYRCAGVAHQANSGKPDMSARRQDTAASVAEAVVVAADRISGADTIWSARSGRRRLGWVFSIRTIRRRLEALVGQLIADAEVHAYSPCQSCRDGSTPP